MNKFKFLFDYLFITTNGIGKGIKMHKKNFFSSTFNLIYIVPFTFVLLFYVDTYGSVRPDFQLTGTKHTPTNEQSIIIIMDIPPDFGTYDVIGIMSDCSGLSSYSEFISAYKKEAAKYGANYILIKKTPGTNERFTGSDLCVEGTALFVQPARNNNPQNDDNISINKNTHELLKKRTWKGLKINVALLDLDAINIPSGEAAVLTEQLRGELLFTEKYTIVERDKMTEILNEQGFQQTGCSSNECAVEIGQLVGVDKIFAGSIGRISDLYVITLRLIDVREGKILLQVKEEIEGDLKAVLRIGIPNIAQRSAFE
jgi:hypothetical protein